MTDQMIPIFCGDCGVTGSVGQVTASLACRSCGSGNLGLVGVDPRPSVTATRKVAHPQGPGTGWTGPDPRRYDGLNEYVGPTPQTFPRSAPVADPVTCPVCHGSKYDLIDKGPCRECGGTGVITHPTSRPSVETYDRRVPSPPGGAEWRGASLQGGFTAEAMARIGGGQATAGRPSADPMGSVEDHIRHSTPGYRGNDPERFTDRSPHVDNWAPAQTPSGPYQMDQASCPTCSHAPTQLLKDKNEDAWWHCPNCGPLANIDQNPDVNPYSPPQGFQPNRNMKTGGFMSRNRKTGRVLRILASIHQANELTPQEAVELARKTVIRYGEGR